MPRHNFNGSICLQPDITLLPSQLLKKLHAGLKRLVQNLPHLWWERLLPLLKVKTVEDVSALVDRKTLSDSAARIILKFFGVGADGDVSSIWRAVLRGTHKPPPPSRVQQMPACASTPVQGQADNRSEEHRSAQSTQQRPAAPGAANQESPMRQPDLLAAVCRTN